MCAKTKSSTWLRLLPALALSVCMTNSTSAQVLDFWIEDVVVCPVGQDDFLISITMGIIPDHETYPDYNEVDVAIDITGPSTAAPTDKHKVKWYKPNNPDGTCPTNDPCPNTPDGCPKWIFTYKAKLYWNQPFCVEVASGCGCAAIPKLPPKKKPKHDGPGPYEIVITVDPDEEFEEANEENNTGVAVLL